MNRLAVGFCGTAFLTAHMPDGGVVSVVSLIVGMLCVIGADL